MSKATAVYLLSTVAASASAKLLTPQDASSSTLAAAGITLHRDHAPGAVRCEELLVPMDDAGAKFLTDEFHVKGFAVGPCPPAYNAFNKRERDYLGFQDVEYRQFMVKDVGASEVVTLVRDHVVDTSDTTNDDHPDSAPAPAPPPPPIFDCRKVKAKPECDQHDHLPYDKCNWCEVTAKNGSWAGCLAPWEIQQLPTGFTCDV